MQTDILKIYTLYSENAACITSTSFKPFCVSTFVFFAQ